MFKIREGLVVYFYFEPSRSDLESWSFEKFPYRSDY
jgi:hypothetical protein